MNVQDPPSQLGLQATLIFLIKTLFPGDLKLYPVDHCSQAVQRATEMSALTVCLTRPKCLECEISFVTTAGQLDGCNS